MYKGQLEGFPQEVVEKFYGDWKPDSKDMEINRARIKERLN